MSRVVLSIGFSPYLKSADPIGHLFRLILSADDHAARLHQTSMPVCHMILAILRSA
jgi:hypothetical protein